MPSDDEDHVGRPDAILPRRSGPDATPAGRSESARASRLPPLVAPGVADHERTEHERRDNAPPPAVPPDGQPPTAFPVQAAWRKENSARGCSRTPDATTPHATTRVYSALRENVYAARATCRSRPLRPRPGSMMRSRRRAQPGEDARPGHGPPSEAPVDFADPDPGRLPSAGGIVSWCWSPPDPVS